MNRNSLIRRKLIYVGIALAMLIPIYQLGLPAGGAAGTSGQIAQLRDKYNLSESDLGEIDPASSTMKLATLGLRGPATTLLWAKADRYRILHEWDRWRATLNQIALLQPHYEKVWEHQAHAITYNSSIEFDDYRQRYEVVREGTEFLTRGVRQNREAPRLIWYTGQFYGSKLGVADEKKQFRRLFSEDTELHESLIEQGIAADSPDARGPEGKPDNWLVGRLWCNYGYDLVDSGIPLRRITAINFYEKGPKWRLKHAESISEEGVLDERTLNAWRLAAVDWQAFGERSMPTTQDFTVQIDRYEEVRQTRDAKLEELANMVGRDIYINLLSLHASSLGANPEEVVTAWTTPEAERSQKDWLTLNFLDKVGLPRLDVLARQAPEDKQLRAITLAEEVIDLDNRLKRIKGYQEQINYRYWKTLAFAEQQDRTLDAHRAIYEAELANRRADLDKTIELYEKAFSIWADVFEDYPLLMLNDEAEDLFKACRRYFRLTDNEEIPDDFPLSEFVTFFGSNDRIDSYKMIELKQAAFEKFDAERRRAEAQDDISGSPEEDSQSQSKEEASDTDEASGSTATDEPDSVAEPEMKNTETSQESASAEESSSKEDSSEDAKTADAVDESKTEASDGEPAPEPLEEQEAEIIDSEAGSEDSE